MHSDLPGAANAIDFASLLNAQQLSAVTTQAQHALVIAGAGSGKTRTLTYRVAWLLSQGVPGWRILLLTFTNKAAHEMLERVQKLVGMQSGAIWGGTFHSIANRILRSHAERLGYRPGFTIIDNDDQKALMRALVKQHAGKQNKNDPFPKPELLLNILSLATNTGRDWEELLGMNYPSLKKHVQTVAAIYTDYARRKREANTMDFDDLLVNLLELLKQHEEVRSMLQGRFLHVLVDEYQDTNVLQDRIISLLSGGQHSCLEVVGDDAQSIYSWRGAQVDHIFKFTERYPDAEVYKIETNYRSLPAILEIANATIAGNERQFHKVLQPNRQGYGRLPTIYPATDNRTEAIYVAQRIAELIGYGEKPAEIAVLYRAHFHSLDIQMELTRRHIPYRITSGLRFFEQAHVKDVVAYLRLLANPNDETAFRRIVSTFPKVGEISAGKMWISWQKTWQDPVNERPPTSRRRHTDLANKVNVPAAAQAQWLAMLDTLDGLQPEGHELTPAEMVMHVLQSIDPFLRSQYENAEERMEDIEQLARSLSDVESLDDFLSQVALLSETDREPSTQEDDKITLSTIHQAKGLEWNHVFIMFLGEGLFPHYRIINGCDPAEVEEETRLFYVAVTRAKDSLSLSYPRYNGHSYEGQFCPPSRFLTALPPGLYEVEQG